MERTQDKGYSRRLLRRSAAVGIALRLIVTACSATEKAVPGTGAIMLAALIKAVTSGSAGFVAGTMQVIAFMWLRTIMNYQYKFGGTLSEVFNKLYAEGGMARLYQGLFPWAIFQAPLSRFGDVASNDLVLGLFDALFPQVPISMATVAASFTSAGFRIMITPIDTCKTCLQTDGAKGWALLKAKVDKSGIFVLWNGWEGNYLANVVGNYPWFATMNMLQAHVPIPESFLMKLVRVAILGSISSSVSDTVSNSIRIVKTKKQTHPDGNVGYVQAAKQVLAEGGVHGLFFRGLETRIYTNVMQGAFFTVLWKYFQGQI